MFSALPGTRIAAVPGRVAGYTLPRALRKENEMQSAVVSGEEREAIQALSRFWWLWLAFGIGWIVISVVILQFDQASVTTVGVIVGFMFVGASLQQFVLAGLAERLKWLFAIFGVLFLGAAILAFISPENTFAAIADILGFLFLI